jgi:mRNA guanylyltransferase
MIDHKDGVLLHENDGLIFTIDACPYYPGTCEEIVKWKPPHMNTIDFDLRKLGGKDGQNNNNIYGLFVQDRDM